MAKKKTKVVEEPQEQKEIPIKRTYPVQGAFIVCQRVVQRELEGCFYIKLSAINQIVPLDNDRCVFYTFKDTCYYATLDASDLRARINSFLFEPETHWEQYPDL